jgi:hypothetical protein
MDNLLIQPLYLTFFHLQYLLLGVIPPFASAKSDGGFIAFKIPGCDSNNNTSSIMVIHPDAVAKSKAHQDNGDGPPITKGRGEDAVAYCAEEHVAILSIFSTVEREFNLSESSLQWVKMIEQFTVVSHAGNHWHLMVALRICTAQLSWE